MIRVKTAFLTIRWDPPTRLVRGSPKFPQRYNIYYSNFGESNWTLLGSIQATDHPSFTVKHSDVGDGVYVFAVSTVGIGGGESIKHTSLDYTANPITGWYVWWMKNE
jgi:hypothetical protein